jgi:mannose-6-phosphate isomerase-like protein (cupin superfamily)
MFVSSLKTCKEIVAVDATILRELLHPGRQPIAVHYSLAHARLAQGKASLRHYLYSSEVYYILEGQGRMHVDDEEHLVSAGDAIYIPPGAQQYIENLGQGELVFLCIVDPPWRAEDETVEL